MDSCFQWADDQGIDYTNFMLTNGTLVTPEIAEELQKYKTRAIQLTLDGPKRIHNKKRIYKNGKGTFDDIINAAHVLQDHNISIHFRINVDKENKPYIGELLNELASLGFKNIPVDCGIVTETQACKDYSPCLYEKEFIDTINIFRAIAEEKGFANRVERAPKPKSIYCGFLGEGNYVLDPHGNVYKCLTFVGVKDHCIGTIEENGALKPSWTYYDWMSRDPLHIEECKHCKMLPACGGGCGSVAYERHRTYHARGCYDPYEEIKNQLTWFLEKKFPEHFKDGKVTWD
jgi:uncharacterized protein